MTGARPALSLKGRALRMLSQREHSRPELERKLARHTEDAEELARALDELQAKGFISEARVVESVLHQRAAQYGALRLRQELQRRGVASAAITEAVAGLADSEFERALALWQRRFAPAADAREHARQSRFLLARGFSGAVVTRVLRHRPDNAD
ncbi:recombination regulator RecX [Pseudorhodoferax sp. LjRoot39]|uniref:recombination regulator RecX n=1 Tax=Pseudorhodoferax sp. LjRoot39 TaxID=3342328 RepID=UPI003ECE9E42